MEQLYNSDLCQHCSFRCICAQLHECEDDFPWMPTNSKTSKPSSGSKSELVDKLIGHSFGNANHLLQQLRETSDPGCPFVSTLSAGLSTWAKRKGHDLMAISFKLFEYGSSKKRPGNLSIITLHIAIYFLGGTSPKIPPISRQPSLWLNVFQNPQDSKSSPCPDFILTEIVLMHKTTDPNFPCRLLLNRPTLPSFTGSKESITFIKERFAACQTNHLCAPKVSSFSPKRVLYLQLVNGRFKVKLIQLNTHDTPVPYVTLSHCWGTRQLLTTTKSTIHQRLEGIEWNSLPPTFQNAITFTLELGYQYLWIDSLCIVQGDKKDWEIESSQMCQIYMSCAIMISALSAKDSSIGCFRTHESQPLHFTVPGFKDGSFSFYVEEEASHTGIDDFKVDVRDCPLATRAWAFQESILAPRIVYFTKHEVVWECVEEKACHCGNFAYDTSSLSPTREFKISCHLPSALKIGGYRTIAEMWRFAVTRYSERQLTEPEDRLPALSGVAQNFRSKSSSMGLDLDIYLAGHWYTGLLESLSWTTTSGPPILSQIISSDKEYIAPSWSWASTQASVKFDSDRRLSHLRCPAEILHAETVPAGADYSGAVKDGHIILSAIAVEGVLKWDKISMPSASISRTPVTNARIYASHFAHTFHEDRGRREELRSDWHSPNMLNREGQVSEVEGKNLLIVQLYDGFNLVLRESKHVKDAWERIGCSTWCEPLFQFSQDRPVENSPFKNLGKRTIKIV